MTTYITKQQQRTFGAPTDATEVISALSDIDNAIPREIRYVGEKFFSIAEKKFYYFSGYDEVEDSWTYEKLKVFGKSVNSIHWNILSTATYLGESYDYVNYEGLLQFVIDYFLPTIDEDFGNNNAINSRIINIQPININLILNRISETEFDIQVDLDARTIFFKYLNLNLDSYGEEVESFLNESESFALPIDANVNYNTVVVGSEVLESDDIDNSRKFRTNYEFIVDYLCDITGIDSDFKFLPGRLYRDSANIYISNGKDNTAGSLFPISMRYDLQPVLVTKDLVVSDWYTTPSLQALPFGARETKNAILVSNSIDQAVVDCMLISRDEWGHFHTHHVDFCNVSGMVYIKSRYNITDANILILYKRTPNSGISVDATSTTSDKENIIPAITRAVHDGEREYDEDED